MPALASAAAGFLLAVLWFDLMFDRQAAGRREAAELPEETLASIAAYYQRVLTGAAPMSVLVALVMAISLAAHVAELAGDEIPTATAATSLALLAPAIAIAALRTVPAARRLGARTDDAATQSALARSILRDHVLCFVLVAAVMAIQLSEAL
jgi:hypothetical protein